MASTALVFWAITALFGFYMLGVSIGISRPIGQPAHTHWRSWQVFIHPSMAVTGLLIWIVYMCYGWRVLGWLAFADLLLVAVLGELLFVPWLKDRRARLRAEAHPEVAVPKIRDLTPRPSFVENRTPQPERVAVTALEEQRISLGVVMTHGALAAITILLVLLSVLGI